MTFFASKIVFWKAHFFAEFLLERIMLSVVFAGFSGVDSSILYLSCDKGKSQKVFGVYNVLGTIGMLVASLIFAVFVGENYRFAAFLTMVSYGAAAFLSLFISEVKHEERSQISLNEFKSIFLRIVGNKSLMCFLIAVAFITQTHQTITVFLNQIQYQKCGLSASSIGLVYIIVTLVGMFGVYSDALTRKKGTKCTGVSIFTIVILSCFLLAITHSAMLSVCGVFILNLANSFFQPLQMEEQNKQVISNNRATELSIYAIIIDSICAGTSVAFGALAKFALEKAFLFGAALSFVGLILFLVWHRSREVQTIV